MKKHIETIWLPAKLLDEMGALATSAYPKETGGVLIGYDAGNGLVVTGITGPGPEAIHESHAYTPDYAYQDAEIGRVYRESGRRHTYLGDWHSHPDGSTTLSSKDKLTLRTIARYRPARASAPIMGIFVGGEPWRLTVWRCFRRDLLRRRFFTRYDEMALVRTRSERTVLDKASNRRVRSRK